VFHGENLAVAGKGEDAPADPCAFLPGDRLPQANAAAGSSQPLAIGTEGHVIERPRGQALDEPSTLRIPDAGFQAGSVAAGSHPLAIGADGNCPDVLVGQMERFGLAPLPDLGLPGQCDSYYPPIRAGSNATWVGCRSFLPQGHPQHLGPVGIRSEG